MLHFLFANHDCTYSTSSLVISHAVRILSPQIQLFLITSHSLFCYAIAYISQTSVEICSVVKSLSLFPLYYCGLCCTLTFLAGFEILAFPCNQFGGQEPGSNPEIKQFACTRFKAEFPIFDKVGQSYFYHAYNSDRREKIIHWLKVLINRLM